MQFLLVLVFLFSQAYGMDRETWREQWRAEWVQNKFFGQTIAPGANDRAENLVDELRYRSLSEMEGADLKRASTRKQPWSDSYWPIYSGLIANRYADANYDAALNWALNERYLLAQLGRGPLEQLSPAEKYDLLVGDTNFTLTKQMIGEGRSYHERYGSVETWMGICHGWAPASYMEDRPARAKEVLAANGSKILFYPSDVKALTTLLWAKGNYPVRFIGGRCNDRSPRRGEGNRLENPDCLDSNPGTWHLAVVNQIGVSRRPFILDVNYDYEVWNQPVIGYQYNYADPKTGLKVEKLVEAMRPVDSSDPRRKWRAPTAVTYVRIEMSVSYMLESGPSTALLDTLDDDVIGSAFFSYDLELDADGKIVGGEWLQTAHPDFLWTVPVGRRARAVGDLALDQAEDKSHWSEAAAVPESWRTAALLSSPSGQPLARIVERLVDFSR